MLNTKLDNIASNLNGQIERLSASLTEPLARTTTEINGQIDRMTTVLGEQIDQRINGQIERLSASLTEPLARTTTEINGQIERMSTVLGEQIDQRINSLVQINQCLHDTQRASDSALALIKHILVMQVIDPRICQAYVSKFIANIASNDFPLSLQFTAEHKLFANAIADEHMRFAEYVPSLPYSDGWQLVQHAAEISVGLGAKRCVEILHFLFRHTFYLQEVDVLTICTKLQEINDWSDDYALGWGLCIYFLIERGEHQAACNLLQNHKEVYCLREIDLIIPLAHYAHSHGFSNALIEKSFQLFSMFQKNIDADVLHSFLRDARVAVVGNGSQQIGKCTGEEIDNYDIVIRFNEYCISDAYRADYGYKTDLWLRWPYPHLTDPANYKEISHICIAESPWEIFFAPHEVECLLRYAYTDAKTVLCFSKGDRRRFCEAIPLGSPTNGIKMVFLAQEINANFSINNIYGFTVNDAGKANERSLHYFENQQWRDIVHNLNTEAEAIARLFANKRDQIL